MYRYKVVHFDDHGELNRWASKGWRVIAVMPAETGCLPQAVLERKMEGVNTAGAGDVAATDLMASAEAKRLRKELEGAMLFGYPINPNNHDQMVVAAYHHGWRDGVEGNAPRPK